MGIASARMGTGIGSAGRSEMGLGLHLVWAPLQALVSFFAPWQAASAVPRAAPCCAPQGKHGAIKSIAIEQAFTPALQRKAFTKPVASHVQGTPAPVRALRVLRVQDAGAPRSSAGRMVISGRMADVCAELERLAQTEAAPSK